MSPVREFALDAYGSRTRSCACTAVPGLRPDWRLLRSGNGREEASGGRLMQADREQRAGPASPDLPALAELQALQDTCRRRGHRIDVQDETIAVLRAGANALTLENSGLRLEIARLLARPPAAEPLVEVELAATGTRRAAPGRRSPRRPARAPDPESSNAPSWSPPSWSTTAPCAATPGLGTGCACARALARVVHSSWRTRPGHRDPRLPAGGPARPRPRDRARAQRTLGGRARPPGRHAPLGAADARHRVIVLVAIHAARASSASPDHPTHRPRWNGPARRTRSAIAAMRAACARRVPSHRRCRRRSPSRAA